MTAKQNVQPPFPAPKPKMIDGSPMRMLRSLSTDLVLISTGSIIFILGLNSILVQHQLVAGGLTGAAIILNHLQPALEIGWWYLLLNLPLIWLGWRRIGGRFMLLTAFGMLFFSLAAVWIKPPPLAIKDPLLAMLAAGVVCGVGAGLVLRSGGSAGGLDVLSVYVKSRFGFSIGTVGFALNAVLLTIAGRLYGLEAALYSALFLFVCSRVVDTVVAGINPPRVMLVISDRADDVGQALLRLYNCRITFLKGEGGYSGGEKKIIYTVASLMEIPKLKACVLQEDPRAFMVVNTASEVTQRKTFAGISPSGQTTTYLERP